MKVDVMNKIKLKEYPIEIYEGSATDKEYYNINLSIDVEISVVKGVVDELFITKINSGKITPKTGALMYEFEESCVDNLNTFNDGVHVLTLYEHGGWGNNEWVTWFRPKDLINPCFCHAKID